MDDGVALSSSLERLKLEALDSFPVVKMFDGCNLAGKGALDGFKRADIFNRRSRGTGDHHRTPFYHLETSTAP